MASDDLAATALARAVSPRVVVLVEGRSDAVVVQELAAGVAEPGELLIVSMDGITNVRRHLLRAGAEHPAAAVLGLYDRPEERFVRRALRELWGREPGELAALDGLEAHGFHVCDADLEEELIRALGTDVVEDALDEIGDLARFRTFQRQPEWRDRPVEDQLHRFAGSGSGRKAALAAALARRLVPSTTPPPLSRLVEDAVAALRDR